MISYEERDEYKCMKLSKMLKEAGHKTWLKGENVSNNIIDGIASAIENALLVLVCYTDEYRESTLCRLEAEYAAICDKPIIPIQMKDYCVIDLNSWLGPILSGKNVLSFDDIFNGSKMEDTVNRQIDMVKPLMNVESRASLKGRSRNSLARTDDFIQSSIDFYQNSNSYELANTSRSKKKRGIWNWENEDVANWLVKNNLSEFVIVFREFNGLALVSLYKMKHYDYKRFCTSLDKEIEKSHAEIPFEKKLIFHQLLDELCIDID